MVNAERQWKRWCGTRSDLSRAIKTAEELVSEGTGMAAAARVAVTLKGNIEERGGIETIERLHTKELAGVESVSVTIEVDWDTWEAVKTAAHERGDERPKRPQEEVSLRISRSLGVSLMVSTTDRVRAEGLRTKLSQELGHGAANFPGVDRDWVLMTASVTPIVGTVAALEVVRAVGLASVNHRWDVAEIFAIPVGFLLGLSLPTAIWWLFPRLEMLAEGGGSRFRRWRGRLFGVVSAIGLGVMAALIYNAL